MPEITIIAGGGINRLDYDANVYGTVVSGFLTAGGSRYFESAAWVKLYCDASDIHSGWSEPIKITRKTASGNEYTYNFHTNYYIDESRTWTVWATKIPDNDVKYDWDGGEDGPSNEKKKKGETYYIPSKKPKRSGYVFRYWTDNLGTGKHWLPGDAYTRDSDVTFKAMWAAKSYFYWHGSNENDAVYFQVDKRVDLAITASNWNRFCYYVNLLRDYCYLPTITFTSVSAENELSASGFIKVSNAIEDCVNYAHSTVHPPTVSKGMLVRVLHYNGPGSLKDAATSVMNALE